MSEDEQIAKDHTPETKRSKLPDVSRFIVFIVCAILIAFVMVVISMDLYQKSGAAQLDLSRPSYEDVRSKASKLKVESFSASGPIDEKSLDNFKKIYDDTSESILEKKESYSPDAMSDKSLGIEVR